MQVLGSYRWLKGLTVLVAGLLSLLVAPVEAPALSSNGIDPQTLAQIQYISREIDKQNLTLQAQYQIQPVDLDSVVTIEQLTNLRVWLASTLDTEEPETVLNVIDQYAQKARDLGSRSDVKIAEIFKLYVDLSAILLDSDKGKHGIEALQKYQDPSEAWFVRHRAFLIESTLLMYSQNLNASLEKANSALSLIPNDDSQTALEASFEANGIISVIYLYLAELDFAAQSVTRYIEQGIKLNRPIDGLALLNSLTFGLEKWGEYETALEVAEISFRLSKTSSADKSVKAHYRYAQVLNELEKYDEAEGVTESGLELATDGIWKLNLQAQYVISLSGQGQVEDAQNALVDFSDALAENPRFEGRFDSKVRDAKALIAIAENRPRDVYKLLNENLIQSTRTLLKNSSDETRTIMGTLANNKEVQRAREAELQLQNTLKQERIEAQARQNIFLMVIIGLLLVLVAGAAIFAFKERRNAAKARFLRDRAYAGERAKSDFLAVMSHELRTPLNGIIGLAEILSRTGPNPDVKFKSGVIYKSGLSLLDLLVNILDMSKMETGKIEIEKKPVNIHDIVTSVGELWSPKAGEKNITFTRFIDPTVPERLVLDGLRLRQCLENLVSNAIKFTKDGRVHVHVTYENHKRKNRQLLKIIVADTGVGMNPQKAADVFSPFTQADTTLSREFGGSGLGLAITRSLSRLMGGDTLVNSALGKGSEFTLTAQASLADDQVSEDAVEKLAPSIKQTLLIAEQAFKELPQAAKIAPVIATAAPLLAPKRVSPAPSAEVLRAPEPVKPQAIAPIPKPKQTPPTPTQNPVKIPISTDAFKGLRVLVVEDMPTNREVLKIFLKPVGCQVSMAHDGNSALEMMKTELFDVVLMDIRMPGINGIDATRAIRASGGPNSQVGIIALTADTSADTNAQCIAAGADVFLTKPVVAKKLFHAINFVVSESHARKNTDPLRTSQKAS